MLRGPKSIWGLILGVKVVIIVKNVGINESVKHEIEKELDAL